jgi:pimeloyl-ACP methyl ester carboxylesterase
MNSEIWYLNGQTKIIKTHPVFFKRDGAGEALICIHGFPSSSWDFEKIPNQKNAEKKRNKKRK